MPSLLYRGSLTLRPLLRYVSTALAWGGVYSCIHTRAERTRVAALLDQLYVLNFRYDIQLSD